MGGDVGKPKNISTNEVKDFCGGSAESDRCDLTAQECRIAVDEWIVGMATERNDSEYVETVDRIFEKFADKAGHGPSDGNYGSCEMLLRS